MITPFYIDDDVFKDEKLKSSNAVHDLFLYLWRNYGVLVLNNEEEINVKIRENLQLIPIKHRIKCTGQAAQDTFI